MDIAAAIYDFPALAADDLLVREDLLQLLNSQYIIFITVLRTDDTAIGDQEVKLGSDTDVAFFSWQGSFHIVDGEILADGNVLLRHGQLMYFKLSALGISCVG